MKHLFLLSTLLCLGLNLTASCATASLDCSRQAGSLPNPALPAGTENSASPIRHIVVIMQENHSFDQYLGALSDPKFYGKDVDGISPDLFNLDSKGRKVSVYPEKNLCVEDVKHGWNAMHDDWNGGKQDGFVRTNGNAERVMGYYGAGDLPFYYALSNQFAIGDRYFSSLLTQTFPNRFYLLAATSFGHIRNDFPKGEEQYDQPTIFDSLSRYGISWKYYTDSLGYLGLFQSMYKRNISHMGKIVDYLNDLDSGKLPQVVFVDSAFDQGEDEHPDSNIQKGQAFVAKITQALLSNSAWKDAVLFLTYDEAGGFYDHVAPPAACAPDSIAPLLESNSTKAGFDQYGFRVPFVAISPYVKHHYVSHATYDHTSILRFIEMQHNLPALSARDANADGFSDLFDFAHPVFDVQALPSGEMDSSRACEERNSGALKRSRPYPNPSRK